MATKPKTRAGGEMTETITIELPLPDRKLSPNARTHYMAKARATKKSRYEAGMVASSERLPSCPWNSAKVQFIFTFRDKRARDRDNLLSQCKATIDGIADSGIVVNDSQMTFLPVEITEPNSKRPGMVIVITSE